MPRGLFFWAGACYNKAMEKLKREFYLQDGLSLAQNLLGKILVRHAPDGVTKGRIVETEAYMGPADAAAHSYKNRPSQRTNIQYGPGGFAYVYLIYGMYYCLNVVANVAGKPEVALIRALEPVAGIEQMEARRGGKTGRALANGPGKLCQAMAIDKSCHELDLCGDILYIEEAPPPDALQILTSRRINIDYAGEAADYPWRFLLRDNAYVSCKPR